MSFVKNVLIFLLLVLVSVLLFLLFKKEPPNPGLAQLDASTTIRSILKLSVMEVQISQIYEVSEDRLKISTFSIPFTEKKTWIAVKGSAQFGYDLDRVSIDIPEQVKGPKAVQVSLPPATILSTDLSYRFLLEEDSVLNPIEPEDRNRMMRLIRQRVSEELGDTKFEIQLEKRTRDLVDGFERLYPWEVRLRFDPS